MKSPAPAERSTASNEARSITTDSFDNVEDTRRRFCSSQILGFL